MSYFSERDLKLIKALVYKPELKPSYDIMRDALLWMDEWARELSSEGFDKFCYLLVARSYIHRGIPFSSYKSNPNLLEKVWLDAQNQIPQWPGFKRLELSPEDRAYYEEERNSDVF